MPAAGPAPPRTRRAAGSGAAFFVGVFPADVKMTADWRDRPAAPRTVAYARLPLRVPLVLWARNVAEAAGRPA
ncbi:hypothetical protein GCM10010145_19900 [Streptomyces ruber]|uniref:Uncharacterized protein n=2 Tax=Streptomyces TaxID=1883 RepID=A0A918BD02_9ACTN|nr:hypothetical protein GCM10010145_19900 [Streptomyces ruber]